MKTDAKEKPLQKTVTVVKCTTVTLPWEKVEALLREAVNAPGDATVDVLGDIEATITWTEMGGGND